MTNDTQSPDEGTTPPSTAAFATEPDAIRDRRLLARDSLAAANTTELLKLPRVGLALSGGGVRSATFGLGLLRGLAENKLLTRLDYLSTVSGGGFIGAMFGRLVMALGIERAQAALAAGNSLLLWWLRANGRYLTPAGSRDLGMAWATYFRAWLAIHLEVATLIVPVCLVIVLPHVWQDATHRLDVAAWSAWLTPWWPLALMWLAVSVPGVMAAYWAARDTPADPAASAPRHAPSPATAFIAMLVCSGIALAVLVASLALIVTSSEPIALPSATVLAAVASFGLLTMVAFVHLRLAGTDAAERSLRLAELRNELTRSLRLAIYVAAVLAAVGVFDIASWQVLLMLLSKNQPWLGLSAGIGGAALILIRVFAERLQKAAREIDGPRGASWGPRLLNLVGIVGLVLLFFAWLLAVQWLVFGDPPWHWLKAAPPWQRAAGLALLALGWIAWTGRHEDTANGASLHSFYRARLTRAYLSVANPGRFDADMGAAPDGAVVRAVRAVTDVVPGDDCSLRRYRPETQGGPIHLINTCLNQTHDDRSGLYNADRKGLILTASARGFEVGRDGLIPMNADDDPGTLGRWIAISGAAAAPGAGSYTSRGWAAMLFLLGVRLGYWIKAPRADAAVTAPLKGVWRWFVKQSMLKGEATATFFGTSRPWWYLSDGGHFDNTGVYALLRRELDFMILVDGSADPQFKFADIENLVRKARIDFDTDIEFYTGRDAAPFFSWHPGNVTVLSPEDLADNHSARGVLLARVTYRRSAEGCRHGTLLVVKPNLHDALDVDLLAYAQRNPTFPHQSTGDQFFDEAQWESYHRLGEDFGRALTDHWLAQLPGWSRPARHAPGQTAPLRRAALATDAVASATPAWRRTARAAAVGATLGIGASGTLLLGAWQAIDQMSKASDERLAQATAVFTEAVKSLSRLDDRPPAADPIASFQARRLVALEPASLPQPFLRKGIEDLIQRTNERCADLVAAKPGGEVVSADVTAFCNAWADAVGRAGLDAGDAVTYWTPAPEPIPTVVAAAGVGVGRQAATATPTTSSRPAPELRGALPPPAPLPPSVAGQGPPAVEATGAVSATAALPSTRDSSQPAAAAAATPPVAPPVATGSSAGVAVPAMASAAVRAACTPAAADAGVKRIRLYTQIYDESMRPAAAAVLDKLKQRDGTLIHTAGIENVTRSAEAQGRRPPVPWKSPCLIVHDPAANLCADALRGEIAAQWPYGAPVVRTLPPNLKPQPGVIELWLPTVDAAAER